MKRILVFENVYTQEILKIINTTAVKQYNMSTDSHKNFITEEQSQTTGQVERCSCCPYGFHIHTDFVKFAEEQLAFPSNDMSIMTIHAPKAKLWCSKRTSVNSMVMNGKSLQTDDLQENSKVRPMKRESALIQKRILNLHSCTPKTNEEIYGPGLLDAIKEFENFAAKAWGKKRSCNTSNLGVPMKDTNQNYKPIQSPEQIKNGDKGSNKHGSSTCDIKNQVTYQIARFTFGFTVTNSAFIMYK